jgi:hypothetical protein
MDTPAHNTAPAVESLENKSVMSFEDHTQAKTTVGHNDDQKASLSSMSQKKHIQSYPEAMISEALAGLTVSERERMYYEIHGVDDPIVEDPDFCTRCLYDFQEEILKLKARPAPLVSLPPSMGPWHMPGPAALILAESQHPQYVSDPTFRLAFLRAENFDAARAAARMVRYFHWKMAAFGESKLCKDITLEDLTPEDMKILKRGYGQALPVRDRRDREIWCFIQDPQYCPPTGSFDRVIFYFSNPTRETQGTGVVFLSFHFAPMTLKTYNPDVCGLCPRMIQDMPVRVASIHHCIDPSLVPAMGKLFEMKLRFASQATRAKTKIHQGSYTECMYALMTFGIPTDAIPMSCTGRVKTKPCLDWLEARKIREDFEGGRVDGTDGVEMFEIPFRRHVLLGRGKPVQQHAGNRKLISIVDDYVQQYDACALKLEKTAMAADLVQKIKTVYQMRFLSNETGVWIECDDETAREKVSNLLRARRTIASQQQQQQQRAGTSTKEVTKNGKENKQRQERTLVQDDNIVSNLMGGKGKRLKIE